MVSAYKFCYWVFLCQLWQLTLGQTSKPHIYAWRKFGARWCIYLAEHPTVLWLMMYANRHVIKLHSAGYKLMQATLYQVQRMEELSAHTCGGHLINNFR